MNSVLHQRWLADLVACIGFYTRVPIPRAVPLPDDFAAAQWAAPLAGLVAGGIGGTFLWFGHLAGPPAELAAALSLASMLLATGCFHEDGLGDVCDGFGGGNTAERKLEIMRDSRIGTFGMCGLTLSLLARWAAITALATVSISSAILAILAAHMAARAPMALFMHVVPAARTTGLSAKLGDAKAWPALLSLGMGLFPFLCSDRVPPLLQWPVWQSGSWPCARSACGRSAGIRAMSSARSNKAEKLSFFLSPAFSSHDGASNHDLPHD